MDLVDDSYVKRFLIPWNAHDVDGAIALMTDNCIWETTRGSDPHGTRFAGAPAVRAAIADLFRTMPDIRYELVQSSSGPGFVVAELLVTATLPHGRKDAFHACDVMEVAGGKVAAKRSYRKVGG